MTNEQKILEIFSIIHDRMWLVREFSQDTIPNGTIVYKLRLMQPQEDNSFRTPIFATPSLDSLRDMMLNEIIISPFVPAKMFNGYRYYEPTVIKWNEVKRDMRDGRGIKWRP